MLVGSDPAATADVAGLAMTGDEMDAKPGSGALALVVAGGATLLGATDTEAICGVWLATGSGCRTGGPMGTDSCVTGADTGTELGTGPAGCGIELVELGVGS